MADLSLQAPSDPTTPTPCRTCEGRGKTYRYRMDDRRYPVRCARCGGSGVEARAIGEAA